MIHVNPGGSAHPPGGRASTYPQDRGLHYSGFFLVLFGLLLPSLDSCVAASRSRLGFFFWRAPSMMASELCVVFGFDVVWTLLGSSTPTGFIKVVVADEGLVRDSDRKSVPTPLFSKITSRALLEVFPSFGCVSWSNPRKWPDDPEADIVTGLGWILRPTDELEAPGSEAGTVELLIAVCDDWKTCKKAVVSRKKH